MSCDTVSYDYTNLESALELAALRLPLSVFRDLLTRVEYVVTARASSESLENEIFALLGQNNRPQRPFRLDRLAANSQQEQRAAA
ncbi:MAG: hypothetical protein HYU57_03120 [Micavibrio aeruginosavorus]|nr:hypothetical protein [Micavibrio aeruginosavorus]